MKEEIKEILQELKEKNETYKECSENGIIENEDYKSRIDKAIEYINKFESIKAYYEYTDEDGYDEYNYDDDFKKDILNILKGDNK